MTSASPFQVVGGNNPLPEYPVELCDAHLTSDYFTLFWHDRWLASKLHLKAPLAVQGAALNLFFLARKQSPVGSLPADEELLARLLRVDLADWRGMMAQPITPLHKWTKFCHGDEVVLGHPVVIEICMDALTKREERKASNEGKAVNMRQKRLAEMMQEMGCVQAMCQDKVLIERLDAWLMENHHGQRRRPQIEASIKRSLEHAAREGWIGQQRF